MSREQDSIRRLRHFQLLPRVFTLVALITILSLTGSPQLPRLSIAQDTSTPKATNPNFS